MKLVCACKHRSWEALALTDGKVYEVTPLYNSHDNIQVQALVYDDNNLWTLCDMDVFEPIKEEGLD